MTVDPEVGEVLALAQRLALEAGTIQRDRFETGIEIRTKSSSIDLVTEVDHACEKALVEAIERERPHDGVLGEEGYGREIPGCEWRWVIDPLDGTTNYAHGYPRFCVSIGVERSGVREVGVIYDPLLDELYHAVRGAGAWLGERRLCVSSQRELGLALVATGFAYDVHRSSSDNAESFARMLKAARGIRRDGSAALDLCYVAAGRLDAYWEFKLHAWDVAAGILIVEEAGGRVTAADAGPVPADGSSVVATNAHLHTAVMDRIRDV
ncbi:MAG: inositol monophosphatase family protein [Myxococcota bacterium]|nr:inositol monophosphatase family protein [Myxococcota bacterium]